MELKLKDEWEDKCVPSEGPVLKKDEMGRRNGHGKTCWLSAQEDSKSSAAQN